MSTHRTTLALAGLLVLAGSMPAAGDDATELTPGQRVRITRGDALSLSTLTGTLRDLEAEALRVDVESSWGDQPDTSRTIPRQRILKLEVQTAPPDRAAAAVKGLAVGFLAGVALVVVQTQLNNGSALCDSSSVCGTEVLIGGALGGGVGTAVGAGLAEPEWTEIDLRPARGDQARADAVGPPAPGLSRRSR